MYSHVRQLSLNDALGIHEINCGRLFGDQTTAWGVEPEPSVVPTNVVLYVDACETDESDMDLLAVCPDLRFGRLARAAMRRTVWTYAEVRGDDCYRLDRLSVWDHCGALVFFARPEHIRNERGWANVAGNPTTAPLVALPWFTFMRALWMRSHKATLGGPGGRRVASPSYHRLFLPLMAHVRGWVRPNPPQREMLLAEARRWALSTLAAGLEAASAAAVTPRQNCWRIGYGVMPSFA